MKHKIKEKGTGKKGNLSRFCLSPFLLKMALEEDIGSGDLTTETLIPGNLRGEAEILAKEAGVLSGGPVAAEIFRLRDRSLKVRLFRKEGARIRKSERMMKISGRVSSILEAERVALNFLGRLSGIATLTHSFVERIKGTKAKIFDTRKTTPLWRELEKYAVRCGGGGNHRQGLWDEILVKDNHWKAVLGLGRRYPGCPLEKIIRRKGPKRIVEIEVENLRQLASLLEGTLVPDRILLDNFPVRELRRAVLFVRGLDWLLRRRYGLRRKRPELEASGGIHLGNVRQVAGTGVDRISVGRLTHSAPALDFSLRLSQIRSAV
ncbi:MAG: carboxylating nicotinate-nucleotide diphosphorylase [Candidatus Omnitrophica bacterium]|nr:carboxylating nicotinate-nucleotide diphosphorylase [Candidatus Omnitrophota bacterium]